MKILLFLAIIKLNILKYTIVEGEWITTALPIPEDLDLLWDALYNDDSSQEYPLKPDDIAEDEREQSDILLNDRPESRSSPSKPIFEIIDPDRDGARNQPAWMNFSKAVFVPNEIDYKIRARHKFHPHSGRAGGTLQNHVESFHGNFEDEEDEDNAKSENKAGKIPSTEKSMKLDFLLPIPEFNKSFDGNEKITKLATKRNYDKINRKKNKMLNKMSKSFGEDRPNVNRELEEPIRKTLDEAAVAPGDNIQLRGFLGRSKVEESKEVVSVETNTVEESAKKTSDVQLATANNLLTTEESLQEEPFKLDESKEMASVGPNIEEKSLEKSLDVPLVTTNNLPLKAVTLQAPLNTHESKQTESAEPNSEEKSMDEPLITTNNLPPKAVTVQAPVNAQESKQMESAGHVEKTLNVPLAPVKVNESKQIESVGLNIEEKPVEKTLDVPLAPVKVNESKQIESVGLNIEEKPVEKTLNVPLAPMKVNESKQIESVGLNIEEKPVEKTLDVPLAKANNLQPKAVSLQAPVKVNESKRIESFGLNSEEKPVEKSLVKVNESAGPKNSGKPLEKILDVPHITMKNLQPTVATLLTGIPKSAEPKQVTAASVRLNHEEKLIGKTTDIPLATTNNFPQLSLFKLSASKEVATIGPNIKQVLLGMTVPSLEFKTNPPNVWKHRVQIFSHKSNGEIIHPMYTNCPSLLSIMGIIKKKLKTDRRDNSSRVPTNDNLEYSSSLDSLYQKLINMKDGWNNGYNDRHIKSEEDKYLSELYDSNYGNVVGGIHNRRMKAAMLRPILSHTRRLHPGHRSSYISHIGPLTMHQHNRYNKDLE
ncbi:hypothetical protein O3M35_008075 [Rhynocoris fuscipes]|uniref:Uncharacterized protein n=1 Tax=Rhynocoris fuscipes TaxID=488301 RepID=A0AAW1D4Y5_9HEMI